MSFELFHYVNDYCYWDKDEMDDMSKFIDFLQGDNCYDRSNKKGHVTAGGFVADDRGNILLNHHKKSGMWFQFGGHSDGNPNSIEVAKREIEEETGIRDLELKSDVVFDISVQEIPENETKGEPKHLHYDVNFLFITKQKNFQISNESLEIKWVTIDEARKLVHPLDKAMRRMIDKYVDYLHGSRDYFVTNKL